jgi:hypothetical protein
MDHRLIAVLTIVGFALEGAGCASESQRGRQEETLMPLQTGSTLHRRVLTETGDVTKKPKKKNESKRDLPKPPAPEESLAAPDRFR